jgi:hypothetical protein
MLEEPCPKRQKMDTSGNGSDITEQKMDTSGDGSHITELKMDTAGSGSNITDKELEGLRYAVTFSEIRDADTFVDKSLIHSHFHQTSKAPDGSFLKVNGAKY